MSRMNEEVKCCIRELVQALQYKEESDKKNCSGEQVRLMESVAMVTDSEFRLMVFL